MEPRDPEIEEQKRPSEASQPREYVLKRSFAAKPSRVFAAWTRPELMAQWFSPKDFTATAELDVRPRGKYRITMIDKDGVAWPIKGEYREISPGEKLVYTEDLSEHPKQFDEMLLAAGLGKGDRHETVTTVTFDEAPGDATKVTVRTRFATAKERDAHVKLGMPDGWGECFQKLDALLAAKH